MPRAGAHAEQVVDRSEAILRAVLEAGANDVVVVAGKGHEPYQEVHGQRLPYSDIAEGAGASRLGNDNRRAGHDDDLLEAALAVGGEARGKASFDEVGSDSRAIRPGQLFVACEASVSTATTSSPRWPRAVRWRRWWIAALPIRKPAKPLPPAR